MITYTDEHDYVGLLRGQKRYLIFYSYFAKINNIDEFDYYDEDEKDVKFEKDSLPDVKYMYDNDLFMKINKELGLGFDKDINFDESEYLTEFMVRLRDYAYDTHDDYKVFSRDSLTSMVLNIEGHVIELNYDTEFNTHYTLYIANVNDLINVDDDGKSIPKRKRDTNKYPRVKVAN